MNAKFLGTICAAVVAGAALGGAVTAAWAPANDATEREVAAPDAEQIEALEREADSAREEAARWRVQAERLERDLANLAAATSETNSELSEITPVVAESVVGDQTEMDAALLEELAEYRREEAERAQRSAERQGQFENWREEMTYRRTDMFTGLIESADNPVEQQRWADIEQLMTDSGALRRQMRDAETDEERALVRDAMRANWNSTQNLLREQQSSVLTRELANQGISDPAQQATIIGAVQSSLSDSAFRMSGFGGRGGPGGGRGFGAAAANRPKEGQSARPACVCGREPGKPFGGRSHRINMTDVATICPPLKGNAPGTPASRPAAPSAAKGRRGTMGLATEIETTDEQLLIQKAQAGDVRAFEQLYRRNASRVYALCLRMCSEPGYAEEMTQEAFIRAWQRMSSFRGEARFSTWLHRVTVNVVLSDRRSRARRMEQVTDPLETQEVRLAARPDAPGLSVDLEEAIATLPEGARDVFVLHDIEGYKHKEIAEMTGIATGTSKAHLHRARRLLREQLDR